MNESESTTHRPVGAADWDAIARHLAGEGTAEESAAVAAWLLAHPDEARAIGEVAAASARTQGAGIPGADVDAALANVHGRMRAGEAPVVPLRPTVRSTRRPVVQWAVAAAAVLVVAAGIARSRRGAEGAGARIVATTTGQVDSVRLADGTRVVLGPSSELTVPAGFAVERREVRLRGAAFFQVTHDASHPFAVRSGRAEISDIGTAFTVRSDDADGVEVAVREGAVRLRVDGALRADLAAGDRAEMAASGALSVRRAGASDDDVAWTRGQLVFRETPVARVRSELRRWYGIELIVADSGLAGRHLTASFLHESRRQVLDVITLALGATYVVHGDTVTLQPATPVVRARR